MFEQFWLWVQNLFGKKRTATGTKQQHENQKHHDEYIDTSDINFTAIIANNLATHTISDSTAEVVGENQRAELLNQAISDIWYRAKKILSSALGTGGCLIVPYVTNGRIHFDIVKQNRLLINSRNGGRITDATVLADSLMVNDTLYYRFVNYTIDGNTLHITNRVTTQYGAPAVVPEWADIQDVAISNVDRVLFGYMKSPVDNRKSVDAYGVPITYGCAKIIKDIKDCMEQMRKEFSLKKVRVQVDDRALGKDPKTGKPLLQDELFIKGFSQDGDLFHVFDPAIREGSYHARLDKLYELLEKQIGTSRGILTAPQTHGATATEIRAALSDTFAIISDIRKAFERCVDDCIYACDVLANFYQLSPPGKYEINYEWSYAMLESSTETWQQMRDLQTAGGMSKAELRAWHTGETLEDAQKAVDEIIEKEPNMQTLLGMSG